VKPSIIDSIINNLFGVVNNLGGAKFRGFNSRK